MRLSCGHLVLYRRPAPEHGDWLWCVRCDTGVRVAIRDTRTTEHGPRSITQLPRGRRRSFAQRLTRATDWASGPASSIELSCGHVRYYRPPSPARGDRITCGCCGAPALVLAPVRRTARHCGPWSAEDLSVPA